jgi:hypothetical protein
MAPFVLGFVEEDIICYCHASCLSQTWHVAQDDYI